MTRAMSGCLDTVHPFPSLFPESVRPPPLAGEAERAVEQSLHRFWANQHLDLVPLRFGPWSPPEPGQKLRRISRTVPPLP